MAEVKAPKARVEVVVEEPVVEEPVYVDEVTEDEAPAQEMEDTPATETVEGAEVSEEAADEQPEEDDAEQEAVEEDSQATVVIEAPEVEERAADDAEVEPVQPEQEAKQPERKSAGVKTSWLSSQFPGHEHAVMGCVCGLLFAIAVLVFGLPRTAFVFACMVIGSLIGSWFDGDERLVNAVGALRGKNK